MRIAKAIARLGVCSRRNAEKLIFDGKVKVNGVKLDNPAVKVEESDKIEIEGKALGKQEKTRLWLFHKPRGVITTNKDPQGRMTVFDVLPKDLPRVLTVGRLDLDTEGLLLLTNDGEFARSLELPESNIERVYRVRVRGNVNEDIIERLERGIVIEGIRYKSVHVKVDYIQKSNTWLTVTLTEGKNREIRKIFEFFRMPVSRLIRISYGEYRLESLNPGQIVEVKNIF